MEPETEKWVDFKWRGLLDEKQQKMVAFAEVAALDYSDVPIIGYNYLLLVAKLAELLDTVEESVDEEGCEGCEEPQYCDECDNQAA